MPSRLEASRRRLETLVKDRRTLDANHVKEILKEAEELGEQMALHNRHHVEHELKHPSGDRLRQMYHARYHSGRLE
jgi:hypothetical protein